MSTRLGMHTARVICPILREWVREAGVQTSSKTRLRARPISVRTCDNLEKPPRGMPCISALSAVPRSKPCLLSSPARILGKSDPLCESLARKLETRLGGFCSTAVTS